MGFRRQRNREPDRTHRDRGRLAPLAGLLCLLLAACAATQPPAAEPGRGGIGVAVRLRPAMGWFPDNAVESLRFARLDGAQAGALVRADFAANGRFFYALNLEPGDYALAMVRSVWYHGDRYRVTTDVFLDGAAQQRLRVHVGPGAIAFVGAVVVKDSGGWDAPDAAQAAQRAQVERREQTARRFAPFYSWFFENTGTLVTVERGEAVRQALSQHARGALAKAGWAAGGAPGGAEAAPER